MMDVIDAKGTGVNEGLNLVIYKTEGEKVLRPRAIPMKLEKYSRVAYAIMSIRSIIRELYDADASIEVRAESKNSKYYLRPSFNQNVTIEIARDILSSVAVGTKWVESEMKREYSSSWKTHYQRR
ncbi:MAG: hypothetical protein ACQEXV_22370 [Bacillota bacterium]